MIAIVTDPHDAWPMLERSYGSRQLGIQSVINPELALTKWDSPINEHCDYMKILRTRLADAELSITNLQFYCITISLTHYLPSTLWSSRSTTLLHPYFVNMLCERSRAIELQKELLISKDGGTIEDPIALMARREGPKVR